MSVPSSQQPYSSRTALGYNQPGFTVQVSAVLEAENTEMANLLPADRALRKIRTAMLAQQQQQQQPQLQPQGTRAVVCGSSSGDVHAAASRAPLRPSYLPGTARCAGGGGTAQPLRIAPRSAPRSAPPKAGPPLRNKALISFDNETSQSSCNSAAGLVHTVLAAEAVDVAR